MRSGYEAVRAGGGARVRHGLGRRASLLDLRHRHVDAGARGAQWESAQRYLRTVVGFPDAELRIALLRLPGGVQPGRSGHHIELLEYRAPRGVRGDARTCNPGNAHVAFMVTDLDAAYAEMKAKGVRFKSAPVEVTHGRNQGGKAVYFLDPDDVTLELIQPAPRAC